MELTRIYARKSVTGLLLSVWVLLGVLALGGFAIGISAIYKSKYMVAGMLIVFNLFLFAAAMYAVRLLIRSLRAEGPLIELSETHFFDKRISREAIPWTGIEWRAVYAKSGSIQIDIERHYEGLMYRSAGDRFSAAFCRLLRFPRYSVSPLATGRSIQELEKTFSRYKPAMK